ncbi:hypothetical protein FKP32DRAFT_265968 [Trametes sanguinea]|nr:hypothetical protein FKP32DRAFT_265968 [Trametes sanguinea]
MKRFCPGGLQYAVIRIDPVAMVEHFNDPIATAEARALETKKYLVYLEVAIDMPFPTNRWFKYEVSLIGATLRAEDPSRGITPDMAIPIYPNTSHPSGRTPIDPETPFPFPNCYHWVRSTEEVRIRRIEEMYDDARAVKLSALQHVMIQRAFSDDYRRLYSFRKARLAAALPEEKDTQAQGDLVEPVRLPRIHVSLPQSTSSSQDSQLSDRATIARSRGDEDTLATGGRSLTIPRCDSPVRRSHKINPDLEAIVRMDLFNLAHDDATEYLPLVDLWFELTEHLTAETIPSPLEFQNERDAVARWAPFQVLRKASRR